MEGERNEDIYLGSPLGRGQMTGAKLTALNLGSSTFLCIFLPKVVFVELSEQRGGCRQTGSSKQGLRGWLGGPESWGKLLLFYGVPNVRSS